MSRLSPLANVMIEHQGEEGLTLVTEYFGSSLKSGRAFAKAIEKAQADRTAHRVIYIEVVNAKVVVQTSVPVIHSSVEAEECITF